ncbi:MAG: hypothetical protein ABL977_12400 [Candidatus Eisenbacteria bacterium]
MPLGTTQYADDRRTDNAWWWLAIALGVAGAARYLAILLRYDAYGIAKFFMADDAYYYFQVARHVAAGDGSTFDGMHVSNGYHPLWLLFTAGIFRLTGGSGDLPLMIIHGLQFGMLIASAVLLYHALKPIDRLAAAFTVALFLASNATRNYLYNGMESSLAFLLVCLLLRIATDRGVRFMRPDSWRYTFGMFALLATLFLTRLETSLFAALWLLGALVLDAIDRTRHRTRILLIGFGLALVAAAYFAVNLQLVGVPMPISGYVKAGGWGGWLQSARVFSNHRVAFAGLLGPPIQGRGLNELTLLVSAVLAVSLIGFFVRPRGTFLTKLLVFGPFVLFAAGFVAAAVFVTHGSFPWYLWPALLTGLFATFALFRFLLGLRRVSGLVRALMVIGTVCFVGAGWVSVLKDRTLADWGPMRGYVMDATIRFIREEIPAGDRVGAYSSGMMTYFSGREMENMEGLANGLDFYHARLKPDTFADYLRRNKIRWIVFRTTFRGEYDAHLAEWGNQIPIVRRIDLDQFYQLDIRARHPSIEEPGVYVLELGI